MSDNTVSLTPQQLQDILKTAISSAVAEATKLNPIEQRKLNEDLEKEKRRALLAVELGRSEEEGRWRRQNSCTHSRDPRTGNAVTKGTGEWTTCGQVHGNDTITLICMRCATPWIYQATAAEREYANNAGLLGLAPPPLDRCLNKNDFAPPPKPREPVTA